MFEEIIQLLAFSKRSLFWLPEAGVGYYPVSPADYPYNEAYFEKYEKYSQTELGKRLNEFRLGLTAKYIDGERLIDIGIGSGSFIEARGEPTYGFDINPIAVSWLQNLNLFRYPEIRRNDGQPIVNASFWDSFEHLPDPYLFIKGRSLIFLSLPIFEGPDHVLNSKHYRKDEHYWYWTKEGLISWYDRMKFEMIEYSTGESELGREDIATFVFRKKATEN
ncbi:MAG: hypothetical protein JSU85_13940 [Candidatus Zixiibacteriota bacterium]|nr:MAG: hypothetical protein JSU85_13940 [candidate division Zixibacteria bacterium]